MTKRALAIVLTVLTLVWALAACDGSGGGDGATGVTTTVVAVPDATAPDAAAVAANDGSLGDANSKRACALLTPTEIEAQFGGPVGKAAAIYPYCQWTVGEDGFVAVTVFSAPIDEIRRVNEVRRTVGGVGDSAFIASTRALFFGHNGVTYSILWQTVGDYTTIESEALQALAFAVLGRA